MNNQVEIYYILPIVFFGTILSISILNPYFKGRNRKRRSFAFAFWLIVTNILISGSVYIIFGKISEAQKKKIEDKQRIESRIRDSLQIISNTRKVEEKERLERDSMVKYLQSYYDAYCINDSNKLDKFYSYPLERYYTLSNVSKERVHERTRFDNLTHKYPNCKVRKDKIAINKLNGDTIEVNIELRQVQATRYFTNFLLGKGWKIFSVTSTISIPDPSDDKKDKKKKKAG